MISEKEFPKFPTENVYVERHHFFHGHENSVTAIAFNPDGTVLASGEGASSGGRILFWDVQNAKLLQSITGTDIGPGYQLLVSESFEDFESLDIFDARALCFSPDGHYLVSAGSSESTDEGKWVIRVWDWRASPNTFEKLIGQEGTIKCLVFSCDGTLLASGSEDRTVILWDMTSRRQLHLLRGHEGGVRCMAFSSDSRLLASSGCDAVVRLWDVASGKQVRAYHGHEAEVTALRFTRDGTKLLSASLDSTLLTWSVES